MRLTAFTDYTLRTLIYLALRGDRLATIADIAGAYGISANHLMKVVHRLGQAGDIETVRGQRGGIRLARPAAEISLGAVVRRTEPDLEIVPCFGAAGICAIQPDCVLQSALHKALQAFLDVLDGYTLADLIGPQRSLIASLGLAPEPAGAPGPR
jgi:Rrf2 family nitric oxide-sensitive transcriptional repressor